MEQWTIPWPSYLWIRGFCCFWSLRDIRYKDRHHTTRALQWQPQVWLGRFELRNLVLHRRTHLLRHYNVLPSVVSIDLLVHYSITNVSSHRTSALFTSNPIQIAVRQLPFYCLIGGVTLIYGWASSYFRDIKYNLFVAYIIYTGGIVGLATVQPGQSAVALGTIALAGVGLAGPLILIITGVQLAVPHHLIATATAMVVSCRTLAASIFVAAYSTALSSRLGTYIPSYIARAVTQAGLPASSIGPFIEAFSSHDDAALARIPGVTPAVLGAAGGAVQQAFADGVRVVFIIAAPFGAVACILCLFLPSFKDVMDRKIDAPLEHARKHHGEKEMT